MKIQQGDQYAIPITIKSGSEVITPENCSDVRVKIDNLMISYDGGAGNLSYNSTDKTWCFPLSEDISFKYSDSIQVQVAVKFDDDYVYSPVQRIDIGRSIIKDKWANV